MFIGMSPTCPRYELVVWRTAYSSTGYVQHGRFDALITIDLGAVCRAVGLLVWWLRLNSFICKPNQDYYPLILRPKCIMKKLSQN